MTDLFDLNDLGRGGVVTDLAPHELAANQLAAATDMVLADDVPTERGGWDGIGATNPVADGFALAAVMAVRFPGSTITDLVVQSTNQLVGKATSGSSGPVVDPTGRANIGPPRAFYRGEVILGGRVDTGANLTQNRLTRWSGNLTGTGDGAATLAITAGSTLVTNFGTDFLTRVPVGCYLPSYVNNGGPFVLYSHANRVASVTSGTEAALSAAPDLSYTGAFRSSPFGDVGLGTAVTDLGVISHAASSTTITGKGTRWLNSGPGYGQPRLGDIIMPLNGDIARSLRIQSVGTNTQITVTANSVAAYTDEPYVILRPAVGSVACVHGARLWIAGVAWAPSTLYLTPPNHEMCNMGNGRFSLTTQAGLASQLLDVGVPSYDSSGAIVALVSTQSGLLVCKNDSVYLVRGEYPDLVVDKVADVGVIDIRAALSVDDTTVIAGTDGIFSVRGGQLDRDLTRGRRGEWRRRARTMTSCVLGVVRGHLFVRSVATGLGDECWVYDLRRDVWLGNWSRGPNQSDGCGPEGAHWFDSARIPGDPDRLLFTAGTRIRVQDGASMVLEGDEANPYPNMNTGLLSFTTGSNIGGPLGRRRRVTRAKVSYRMEGSPATPEWVPGGAIPVFTDPPHLAVESNGNPDALGTVGIDTFLPCTTAPGVDARRVHPAPPAVVPGVYVPGAVGVEGRGFQMRVSRVSGGPGTNGAAGGVSVSRCQVHGVEFETRGRRRGA